MKSNFIPFLISIFFTIEAIAQKKNDSKNDISNFTCPCDTSKIGKLINKKSNRDTIIFYKNLFDEKYDTGNDGEQLWKQRKEFFANDTIVIVQSAYMFATCECYYVLYLFYPNSKKHEYPIDIYGNGNAFSIENQKLVDKMLTKF